MAFNRGEILTPSCDHPTGVSVKTLMKQAHRVYIRTVDFIGKELSGEIPTLLSRELCSSLHIGGTNPERLLELSLDHLAGERLSETSLQGLILWAMQNKQYLEADEGIPIWYGQPPIWICVRVVDGKSEKLGDIKTMRLVMRAYTGVVAGQYLELLISPRYICWLLKEIGYPRYAHAHESEIVGALFWALIGLGERGRPRILKIGVSSSMKTSNKTLFHERVNKKCSFPNPCRYCLKTTSECGLACRAT